jgi:sugar transferase (PEP-CTERM/EpsH1 system associated)
MLLRLRRAHRLHVAAFIDDPKDLNHLDQVRRAAGGETLFLPIAPVSAHLRDLRALLTGRSIVCSHFRVRALERWIARVVIEHELRGAFVSSSAMADYAMRCPRLRRGPMILDMVDVDSAKYGRYSVQAGRPIRWIYALEARRLGRHERRAAQWFDSTLLVAHQETALLKSMAPESESRIQTVPNGVDLQFFDPRLALPNPFPGDAPPILVFVGRMDYPPNEDAAAWFARAVLPMIAACQPAVRFWIVGANPSVRVRRLAGLPGVSVTGRVHDVRPYLAHARVAVVPLRLAFGVQNKVLEAMAMGCPVVATTAATRALSIRPGRDALVADTPAEFADAVALALNPSVADVLGQAGRAYVENVHVWEETLRPVDQLFGDRDPFEWRSP